MARTTHELRGIEADNLLGFLTTIGCLATLDTEQSEWRPRISWRVAPLRAFLHLRADTTEEQIAIAADAGCRKLGASVTFDREDVKFSLDEFRAAGQEIMRGGVSSRALAFAALGSDGAPKRDAAEIEPTPYCLMFGQGHQHFLERLQGYLASQDDGSAAIAEALFQPWQYQDDGETFRWDPVEDRRYAHQFGNPSESQNKLGTVRGANRLAAVGFLHLTSAPRSRGLTALGVAGSRHERGFCWPLPAVATSLAGYLFLLGHPDLADPEDCHELAALGVAAVARARRIQSGKFFSVQRARLTMLDSRV